MMRKIAVKALQRGVGSMDYIQSLLLEDDDEINNTHNPLTPTPTPQPSPSPTRQSPEWCKCIQCRTMQHEIENKCCGQKSCVTLSPRFTKLVLDPEVGALY